jgi:hypothetical protein
MTRHRFVPDPTGFPGCAAHVVDPDGRTATCDRSEGHPVHTPRRDAEQAPVAGGLYRAALATFRGPGVVPA